MTTAQTPHRTRTAAATAATAAATAALMDRFEPLARSRRLRMGGVLAVLAAAVCFPLVFGNPATTSVAMFTLLYAAAASAWNLFSGFTGYIALGNAVFFGSGAYFLADVTARLHVRGGAGVFAFVPLAGLFAGVVAVPVGWLALRTRRHTFVVITIAIFFIFQLLAYNLHSLTNGSAGLQLPFAPWPAATYNDWFYAAALVLAVVSTACAWLVRRSRTGLELLAVRDDEDRARGLGVRTGRLKLAAFVLAGTLTGMCGAVYAYYLGSIYPPFAFDAIFDLTVALMSFLGGLGTVSGPVVGALVLEPIQQYLTVQLSDAGVALILFGALFLLVIGVLPEGIVPSLGRAARWARGRAGR
ncbi:branched-chain amino acid ABC transporter permease [Phaeacidiphilus oryzae]|uniref:branched-chain amino acid ABC transporter permease n=1 Tax=Phaeacidiphilus oryzae TaxID=348818 RepID=UPI00056CC458|nr:branched-chain amino acid ABC transporter permease [Phaeacidiphilus oryzae]